MKAFELRELSIAELNARLKDESASLQKLNFSKAVTGQLENPARIMQTRREIARLKTIIKEKNSAE